MRVLITGITGMVGSHLADYLLTMSGVEIYGIKRWRSPLANVEHLLRQVTLMDADLRDSTSIRSVMSQVRPDRIFHLAAQSYVSTSFTAPRDTIEANVIGTLNLLEAVRSAGIDPLIHVCSSSEVYGQVKHDELPIKESNPLRPASPYAVSKVGEDMLGYQYHASYGLRTIRSRAFTHTGPRRGSVFAESSFARQIAEAERGLKDPVVHVGNLNSVRTVLDVRDIVRAYWLLLEKGTPGDVYNIGGTNSMRIGELLNLLIGMSKTSIRVEVDPARLRPSDVTLQVPCIDKFTQETGWKPGIPVNETLKDLLDYWRTSLDEGKCLN